MDDSIDFCDVESGGGDKLYTSSPKKSNDVESDGEENALSYFEAATEALKAADAPVTAQTVDLLDVPVEGSTVAREASNESPRRSFASGGDARQTQQHDLLDVPVDRPQALSTNGNYEVDNNEETIVFDERSPRRPSRKDNQEYYDVLEMASSRLRQQQEGSVWSSVDSGEVSSEDEDELHCSVNSHLAVRKKKKKKKKSKKKEKRKNQSKGSSGDDEEDVEVTRRSSVFQTLFPSSMMVSHGANKGFRRTSITEEDLAKIGYDVDPNEDLPTRWDPASLVTAAQSKISHGKIDKNGFYNNVKGRAGTAYGKVQTLVKGSTLR